MGQASPILEAKISTVKSLRMTGIMYLLISALFFFFSFWNGLYFDKSFMTATIYWSIVIIGFLAWLQRSQIKVCNLLLADYLVLAYFSVYFLSVLLWPANVEYAVIGFLHGVSYIFLYLIIRIVTSVDERKQLLLNGLILSGFVFGVYGLANGFGSLNVNGAIFDPQMRRLAANFEYSNTYAIFQAVMFILAIGMTSLESSQIKKSVYAVASYIMVTSVILAYSRGTWLVLAGMLMLLFLIVPKGNKSKIVTNSIVPLIIMLLTIPWLSNATLNSNGILGWITFGIGLIGVVLLDWVVSKIRTHISLRQWKFVLAGTGIVSVVGVILLLIKVGLPHNLTQRFESINLEQFSVVQRFIFYKDGLKILSEHPILGAGPNAWPALYQRYQSYPYVSRQSHSFLIDTFMSVGILGTLVFFIALVFVVWTSVRYYRSHDIQSRFLQVVVLSALLGLLVHGAIDFDFSYGTINFLMWTLIALLIPKLDIQQGSILLRKIQISTYQKVLLNTGIIISLVSGILAGGFLLSDKYIAEVSSTGKSPDTALKVVQNATAVAPYRASLWLERAKYEEIMYKFKKDSEMPVKIKGSVERAISLAPFDPEILREASIYLGRYGGGLQTIEIARRAWENGHYKIEYPEQYIIYSDIAGSQLYKDDKTSAKKYFNQALGTYYDVEKRIADFKNLPSVLKLEYKYDITSTMRLNAGESAYYLSMFDEANKILEPLQESGNEEEKNKSKVILAAIQGKQKKPIDISVFALVAKDKQLEQYFTYLNNIQPLK